MLILSTIGTSLGLLGLFSIPDFISALENSPLYATCALLLCGVTLVSVVALIMLWQKKHVGYLLKQSTYAVVIIVSVVALFGVDAYSQYSADQAIAQMVQDGVGGAEVERITRLVVPFATQAAVVMGIVQSVVFGFLWRAAWKKQLAYDKENS